MRLARTICEQCGGTYSNKDAIGFSGFLTLAAGADLNRPDETKQFCSLQCLRRWCKHLLKSRRMEDDQGTPGDFAVEVPGWGGITHSTPDNAQLREWWHKAVRA
jgi:hypothetical protein